MTTKLLFKDIPQFTQSASYTVDVSWDYLHRWYARSIVKYHLDINPEFQRGYVWSPEQKTAYVEFILQGGMTGRDIYCNCPGWRYGRIGRDYPDGWYVLVDGKQRLDAVLGFLNNEVPIFEGRYRRDYSDKPSFHTGFKWHVNDLQTYQEVLQWYLDLNSGGTVHTYDELFQVRSLLRGKPQYLPPGPEEILMQSRMDREPVQAAIKAIEDEEERCRENAAALKVSKIKNFRLKKELLTAIKILMRYNPKDYMGYVPVVQSKKVVLVGPPPQALSDDDVNTIASLPMRWSGEDGWWEFRSSKR